MQGSLRSVGVSGAEDKKGLLGGVKAAASHPFRHPPIGERLWVVTWRPEGIQLTWSRQERCPLPGALISPPTHSTARSRALSLVRLPCVLAAFWGFLELVSGSILGVFWNYDMEFFKEKNFYADSQTFNCIFKIRLYSILLHIKQKGQTHVL